MLFTVITPLSVWNMSVHIPITGRSGVQSYRWDELNKQTTVFWLYPKVSRLPKQHFCHHERSKITYCSERVYDGQKCGLGRQHAIFETQPLRACVGCAHMPRYRDVVDFQKRWHHRFSAGLLGGGSKHSSSQLWLVIYRSRDELLSV